MWRYVIPLLVLCHASWGVAGVWTEDFTGSDDTTPTGWTITTKGDGEMSIQGNELYMDSPAPGPANEALGYPNKASFPVLNAWDQTLPYRVEFDFKLPDTTNHWFFVYVDQRVHTVIDYNDDFKYRYADASGSKWNVPIMDLTDHTNFYSMRYDVFPGDNYYDIYVDGALKKAGAGFLPESPNWDPFWIGDRPSGSGDYGSAYWDNFKITTNIPEPASVIVWTLLGLFFLEAYRRRRGGAAFGAGTGVPSDPSARRPWPAGTTEAILQIIERGRMRS